MGVVARQKLCMGPAPVGAASESRRYEDDSISPLGAHLAVGNGAVGSVVVSTDAGAAGKSAAKASRPLAPLPTVKEPIRLTPEGLRLGMQQSDVIDFYNKVLDQDYVPIFKATRVGPKLKDVEAELADKKLAFPRSEVAFGDIPTGIDNTPLKGEYNYKNNETMMSLTRQGMTRRFFFNNKRLWKIYDDIPLQKESELGATYQDAIGVLTKRYGVAGRVLAEDAEKGRSATEVDWADGSTHVRAIDRSYENVIGVVFQDRQLGEKNAQLRAEALKNAEAIDPSIAAITRGGPAVDSNASAADAYTGKAHAAPPGPAAPPAGPPKKK